MHLYICIYKYIQEYIIYNEILAIKKKNNEIMLFAATWMDLIILREVSQKEKDKYHMLPLLCGI